MSAKAPSWFALTGKSERYSEKAPLHHKPEVISALLVELIASLPQSARSLETWIRAKRWITSSPVYQRIDEYLKTFDARKPRNSLSQEDMALLLGHRKLERTEFSPSSWCNAFFVFEERDESVRRRPIFEPIINDVIALHNEPDFDVSVQYTPRDEIRRAVALSDCAAQFDFSAWFDQIPLHPDIRKFFGVLSPEGPTVANVLVMGHRGACQVANAATTSIADVSVPGVMTAVEVDNVCFAGTADEVTKASRLFIERADSVHAVLKDRSINLQTQQDFLGEHYDYEKKTRSLTQKTAKKARFALELLQVKDTFRSRQLLAVYGLLLYAANTLRVTIARFHWAMRFLSVVSSTDLSQEHRLPPGVRVELIEWAKIAAANMPVAVWLEDASDPDFTIYTDASATGWGAVSISRNGSVLQLSEPWSAKDLASYDLRSSVHAEPLAIVHAVQALVPSHAANVVIFTDHLPFVYAFQSTFGRAWSYSMAVQHLMARRTRFQVRFVDGESNPADVLSRARHPPQAIAPPFLPVTSIADHPFKEGE